MMSFNKISHQFKVVVSLAAVALSMSACGSGKGQNIQIQGVTGPTVAYVNGDFTMSVVLQNASLDAGLRLPIPHMPNSYLEVGPDLQSNGLLISAGLAATDLNALAHGSVVFLDPQALPGGRPLPGVAQGTLPAIAVQVPKWDHMVFYVGPSVFGVFVPVKLGMQNYMGTFRFYDKTGVEVGNISIVGEDSNGLNSGFVVLIPLKGAVGAIVNSAPIN